ncbi:HAD family phosphatase [Mannheimia sp. AT1]|uniref:phosphoglycolate phosphatase n=1 Tax=Mannheimia cairinae TaxID=3025936 RepID=A0ABT5MTX3_9PAST|nr:HAD family phosphatase [Mannheimia cairinae]MDD0824949.1 HAD family phosphatase [Mannheimia cairinae]MDD0826121.1 HAD family phosphatase [Mannheimia cairinae]
MLQAIIFDMDGVIVDTEYLEFSLQKQFIENLKEHDRPITLAEQSVVVGKCLSKIPVVIKKLAESSLPIEEIRNRYYAFFHEIFSTVDFKTIFRSDIQKILLFAKQNQIKLAVASSSETAHIKNILTVCGIIDEFDLIVSGEQFEHSKPDPTIYRYTCEKLGVQPQNAVAVEDSYYGMLSAKTAGLAVIGYEEKRMLIDQSLADYMGKDIGEILEIIQQLYSKRLAFENV